MAEYNVAQIGTFDCENIGDLIFPTVLKGQLDKRIEIKNHFLFSLNNCTRPLDEYKWQVYSIDRLEEIHLAHKIDAIIFGGGDLVRFDNNLAIKGNYNSKNTSFDLLFYSIFVSSKYNIPLLFNCPGVPFEFTDSDKKMLNEYLEHVDYLSVRDNKSRALIKGTGTKKEINVFPDSVLSISEVVDVSEALESLKARYGVLVNKYFVFQSFPPLADSYVPQLKKALKEVVDYYNIPIIFLPIGRVHNDHVFLKELMKELNDDRFIYIEEKLNLTESSALLSGASLFIGTSLHGNVISNAYGVPSIALDVGDLIKVRNSFKLLEREEYCIKDVSLLKETVDQVLKEPKLQKLPDAIALVNKHFDILAEKIQEDTRKSSFIEALRSTYYHKTQNRNTLTFYFDCGNGFSQNNIKEFVYYEDNHLEADVFFPNNCKRVRIDPMEGVFTKLKNLKASIDGVPCKYTHNGLEKEDILFYNTDPQIFIEITGGAHLNISFDIEVMPYSYCEAHINSFNGLPEKAEILEKSLSDTLTHVRNLEAMLKIKEEKIEEYEAHIDGLTTKLTEMENSTSWKITKPLRKIKK